MQVVLGTASLLARRCSLSSTVRPRFTPLPEGTVHTAFARGAKISNQRALTHTHTPADSFTQSLFRKKIDVNVHLGMECQEWKVAGSGAAALRRCVC